jgi:hypothetical protein
MSATISSITLESRAEEECSMAAFALLLGWLPAFRAIQHSSKISTVTISKRTLLLLTVPPAA